jgi:GTPase SAR1 family protein
LTQQVRFQLAFGELAAWASWYFAGQERFHAITATFLRNQDVYILVYSLDDITSIESVSSRWLPMCLENCKEDSVFVLLGNKMDLVGPGPTAASISADGSADETEVTVPEGRSEKLVETLGWMKREVTERLRGHGSEPLFAETSAKTGENVNELFGELSEAVFRARLLSAGAILTDERTDRVDLEPSATGSCTGGCSS